MRRRGLTALGLVVAACVILVALLPYWLPAAARPIAARYGAQFSRYERIGYTRFALHDVTYSRPGVVVTVDRLEVDSPVWWAWRHWRGTGRAVVGGQWTVQVQKRTTPPSPQPSGWVPLRGTLQRVAGVLNRWLPSAEVGRGTVQWPGGSLALDAARWEARSLHVKGLKFRNLIADADAGFSPTEDLIAVSATSSAHAATAELDSRGPVIKGTMSWWGQPSTVDATFADQGWMPSKAAIEVAKLNLPGERLKLGGVYRTIAGTVRVAWADGHAAADVSVTGDPATVKPAPPLAITFHATGTPTQYTIRDLHATIPGGVADLSEPVTIDRDGRFHESAARFAVKIDLAQQPWTHARGLLNGEARVVPAAGRAPSLAFSASADGVEIPGSAWRHATIAGRLDWPLLRLEQFSLAGVAGEELHGAGAIDLRQKHVTDAKAAGTITPASIGRWLGGRLTFARATIDASASGDVKTLAHRGHLVVEGVKAASLQPARVEIDWQGQGADVTRFSALASAGEARVQMEGSANAAEARLARFVFAQHGDQVLQLTQPARIAWRPNLRVDNLHLSGPHASLDANLVWGPAGRIEAVVRGFASEWLGSFMRLRGPAWRVPSLALDGSWDHGAMTYATAGELELALPEQRHAIINIAAKGTPDGLTIDALHAVESGNAVVNASGRIPLVVSPGEPQRVAIEGDRELRFDATTVPNAAFWQQLATMTGIELRAPQVSAHLNGTWNQPRGTVVFRVDHAAMDPKRFARPMPTVESVDIALAGDRDGIELERFSFTIEGQLVRASGRLAVKRDTWSELTRAPLPYLQEHSELRVEVPNAEVAMFSRFLPAALAPAGRLEADVRFNHGTLGGFLRLRDAASRPLGPLGVLQQVSADVAFTDHQVNLERVTATMGGQPVTLTGSVALPESGWVAGALSDPQYDIALRGTNLPFVRQSGLLVRGDLDLRLKTPAKGPPGIQGKVVLRDSLFLADVRSFLPHGGGASPSRRPPYFSIDTPPLNTWTLDVDVTGARFIRMRTPVFAGVASARFHLGGTLGVPRAIGDAVVDEGTIRMPFARFDVKQGAVRLTEENPYEPTIFLRGAGRHYGYDLTMEVTGKASSPNITFTSSPALDSEQVLLMVMTGAAPSNEINSSLSHRAVQIGAFFGQSLVGSLTGGGIEPDRLTIESGEKISEQGKETYSIEYKLNDRWSVTGEYDEYDEYNAGFKWRVAPRKK